MEDEGDGKFVGKSTLGWGNAQPLTVASDATVSPAATAALIPLRVPPPPTVAAVPVRAHCCMTSAHPP
ncbi:hypothetical protein GCM10010211_63460 [Streptomyces albospinus]|uniref:Uncharacterized protein n=1 Tax=Streptomyces albospinus TaxID=285515 RepID=A0ABQ2VI68_9ACTN|nr:hypothetical protein GCM10010211_63460 [Streptomyces albospinus]